MEGAVAREPAACKKGRQQILKQERGCSALTEGLSLGQVKFDSGLMNPTLKDRALPRKAARSPENEDAVIDAYLEIAEEERGSGLFLDLDWCSLAEHKAL